MPTTSTTCSQCNSAKVRRCLKVFFSHLFSNLGLFTLVVGYVLLGAIIFEFLESDYEIDKRGEIQKYREECLRDLWSVTERLNVLYEKNWTILVHEHLRKFEKNVVEAAKMEGYDGKELMDADRQWSFSGALLYSVTVITTIGYGNLAPKTSEGKLMTMLYAVIGVPLMLLCLSNLGSLLAGTFQFVYSHVCCASRNEKKHESSEFKLISQVDQTPKREQPPETPIITRTCTIDPRNRNRTRPLTPEVRKLLTECAEYSLNQSNNPDQSTQKLLRELQENNIHVEHNEDSEDNSCKEIEEIRNDVVMHGTPSRAPLLWSQSPAHSTIYKEQRRPPTPPPRRHSPEPSGRLTSKTYKVPAYLVLMILAGYICIGAAVFAAWEDWSFLDGAYFCFITLSTIGFGDLVPGKSFQRSNTRDGQLQLVACSAYLLLGLVLIAMSFTLVQEEVLTKCRQVAFFLGILKPSDHSDCNSHDVT